MARTYDICELKAGSYSSSGSIGSGGRRKVTTTVTQVFQVMVGDDSTSIVPADVTEVEIACLAALPQVGWSVYYSASTGLTLYNAVCSSKSVTRDRKKGLRFEVHVQFKTNPLDAEVCAGSPVDELSDIAPQVTAAVDSSERVLYSDANGAQCWKLPVVDIPFDSPVTTMDPRLNLTITQYESFISDDQMQGRSFVVNSDTYRGLPAGRWRCRVASATEQQVQLSGGSVTAVQVTYVVERSDAFYVDPNSGNPVITGWKATQPLVSPKIISPDSPAGPVPPRLVRKSDLTSGEEQLAYINPADGTERQTGQDRPDYLVFDNYAAIPFNSFLQI
jgi:hypothetical protein